MDRRLGSSLQPEVQERDGRHHCLHRRPEQETQQGDQRPGRHPTSHGFPQGHPRERDSHRHDDTASRSELRHRCYVVYDVIGIVVS